MEPFECVSRNLKGNQPWQESKELWTTKRLILNLCEGLWTKKRAPYSSALLHFPLSKWWIAVSLTTHSIGNLKKKSFTVFLEACFFRMGSTNSCLFEFGESKTIHGARWGQQLMGGQTGPKERTGRNWNLSRLISTKSWSFSRWKCKTATSQHSTLY